MTGYQKLSRRMALGISWHEEDARERWARLRQRMRTASSPSFRTWASRVRACEV